MEPSVWLVKPPLGWRLFNLVRRWSEDRHAGQHNLVPQLKQLWKRSAKRRVEFVNLRQYRDARRRVNAA